MRRSNNILELLIVAIVASNEVVTHAVTCSKLIHTYSNTILTGPPTPGWQDQLGSCNSYWGKQKHSEVHGTKAS